MRNSYKGYWFYIESNVERKRWELLLENKSSSKINFVMLKQSNDTRRDLRTCSRGN
jgi:hypothetical protein